MNNKINQFDEDIKQSVDEWYKKQAGRLFEMCKHCSRCGKDINKALITFTGAGPFCESCYSKVMGGMGDGK